MESPGCASGCLPPNPALLLPPTACHLPEKLPPEAVQSSSLQSTGTENSRVGKDLLHFPTQGRNRSDNIPGGCMSCFPEEEVRGININKARKECII